MDLNLKGKTALVCGSTQGIGRATAMELALLGANVTLIARNEDALRQTVERLDNTQGQIHRYFVADFSRKGEVKEAIDRYLRLCPEVHILINNTGGPSGGPIIEADVDQFMLTFQMHVINNQILSQAVIPFMKQAGYGRIINIVSTSVKTAHSGSRGFQHHSGAVASWAKTMSIELGPFGINTNNVLPGFTKTSRLDTVVAMRSKAQDKTKAQVEEEMTSSIPNGRFVEAQEVAAAVAFLCTPAAASINGINLPVDGGKTESL